MPRDFDEIRKLASLPTRVVSLCLAGELIEEFNRLERELAQAKPVTNLGDGSRRVIVEQILAVQDQMRDATVDFHLRALGVRVWSRMWANRPERGEQESADDFDTRAFPYWAEMISRVCIDPVMSTEQVGELCDFLPTQAWNALVTACIQLNVAEVDVPNFVAASDLNPNSEQM